jgi:alpha-aminoadipic semialdehyde synthase
LIPDINPPTGSNAVLIGIRREDKNHWERRVPLVPADLAELQRQGLEFRVQPSANRIYSDIAYQDVGVALSEDLAECGLVLAVKEIPRHLLEQDKVYVYFSHTIKGQAYNMPMLRRLLDLGCTLLDYERIVDGNGRRLLFFSIHAGYAGAIDTLWTLGQRLQARGVPTPLAEIKRTHEYCTFEGAKSHLRVVGEQLHRDRHSITIGIAGYGNVAAGCAEVLECLPVEWISPEDLLAGKPGTRPIRCVEFREEHMARRRDGGDFALQEYYDRPELYEGRFEQYLPHLDVLLNTIYWEPRYPRLVTREWVGANRDPKLQVIGDISCDYEGAIEITLHATMPDKPSFTYNPDTGEILEAVDGPSPAVMAVDNLPCELSRESSQHFSRILRDLVPALARADWTARYEDLDLPPELMAAVIVHRGELTPDYRYLEQHLTD